MSFHLALCEDLVIAQTGTATRWVDTQAETSDAWKLLIIAPAALDAGTYTIQVSEDGSTSAGTLNTGSADVAVPAAGKAVSYDNFAARYFRISGPAAASARTFKLRKLWNAY